MSFGLAEKASRYPARVRDIKRGIFSSGFLGTGYGLEPASKWGLALSAPGDSLLRRSAGKCLSPFWDRLLASLYEWKEPIERRVQGRLELPADFFGKEALFFDYAAEVDQAADECADFVAVSVKGDAICIQCGISWSAPARAVRCVQTPKLTPIGRLNQWESDVRAQESQQAERSMRVICTVREVGAAVTRCFANINGIALPVDLPTAILRARGVLPGERFEWSMRQDGTVQAEDVSPLNQARLSAEEESELDELYAKHRDDTGGDIWKTP